MTELRNRVSERLIHLYLPWGVVQVVVSPYHMGHLHGGVVYHNTEVVCRPSIGAAYNKIVKLCVFNYYSPLDDIVHDGETLIR
jgi:hypothetical protein